MTLPLHAFKDPLQILIERENRTCKGCRFEIIVFDKRVCNSISRKHGKKCSAYQESWEIALILRKGML